MVISPAAASRSRNKLSVMEDLPAPVRPTIPICCTKAHTQTSDQETTLLINSCLRITLSQIPHPFSSFDAQREFL